MNHYLVIDMGTGNSRVALVNQNGEIKDIESFENRYYADPLYADAQYFSPDYWQEQIILAIKSVIDRNQDSKIDAISSSGARQSCVLIDKNGKNLIGLPNIDNRGKAYMGEIPNKTEIYHKTGSWVTEDCIASKIYGLRKCHEDIYKKALTFTSLSEWVGYFLTGVMCIEPSQATETLLFDLDCQKFSDNLIKIFGLEDLEMPACQKAGTCIGTIKNEIKEFLNIDYDIPFIVGGADTQIALKGAGMQIGDVGVVSGTTSPVVTLIPEKYTDEELRCWTGLGLKGEGYQVETNPGVTGLNYQRIRNLLFDKVSYDDLEYALEQIKEIKCVAFFTSLDFENARGYPTGGFFMKPPFNQDFHREDMAWAIVADIACAIYHQYRQLISMTGSQNDTVLCCGGGFQSKMLCQHLANLTQKTLRLPKNFQQASVLGAAIVCNDYYSIDSSFDAEELRVIPNNDSLIKEYYKKWEKHRNRIITTREDV